LKSLNDKNIFFDDYCFTFKNENKFTFIKIYDKTLSFNIYLKKKVKNLYSSIKIKCTLQSHANREITFQKT